MINKGGVLAFTSGVLKDMLKIETNLKSGHEELAKLHNNYQKRIDSRNDTKVSAGKSLNALWKEDNNKYENALANIKNVRDEISKIDDSFNEVNRGKNPSGYVGKIDTSLGIIKDNLTSLRSNVSYLKTRYDADEYYMGQQAILADQNLAQIPALIALKGEIATKVKSYKEAVESGKFTLGTKIKNLPSAGLSPIISKVTGGKITKTQAKKEERGLKTQSIGQSLSGPATSLSNLGDEERKNIQKYVGSRKKADVTTKTEDLIYQKLGLNKEQILGGQTANMSLPPVLDIIRQQRGGTAEQSLYPNMFSPIKPPSESSKNLSPALQEASPVSKEVAKKIRKSVPKKIIPEVKPANVTTSPITAIEDILPAKSSGGSIGGGGSGGSIGGGGGGSIGGASGGGNNAVVDVRLVEINKETIKQLDDLLVKVLGKSNITRAGGEETKKKNEEKKAKKEKLDDPNSEESIAKAIRAKKRKERDAETIRKADPNSPESLAEKLKNAKAAISLEETIRKADPNSPESLAEKIRAAQAAANAAETIRKADPNSPESIARKIQEAKAAASVAETIRKADPNSPESLAKNIRATQAAQSAAETIRKADPNSPESLAKKIREENRLQRDLETIRKADPNSPESIAKKKKEADAAEKEANKKLKSEKQADPFRNRLQGIYKDSKQEVTFLYDKLNSFFPLFNSAQAEAKKTALNTLKAGYEKFDEVYASTGSAFKGMMASVNAMFKVSPITVIMAGLTTAFIGILSAANRLNTRIKEISAELGTSNMQSYELFKNAMNAQTQYDNMYASLRDVRDVQKGILGDSGILLQTNDKALASVADNAKNIGLSVESAGAFYENLRMKGGSDKESSNLMAASLELADKKGFSPQSIVDDIAQNAEFASKYFSNINKHSKSAHRNLIETNLQVKALGLNFQKAAKMTQHLLSFEQSIVAEVEASVALGRHVNIGKARELLLQDDIAGAMTQMMDTMGGYDEFQNMDFAKRQLMANAIGMEVSELEKSLYLREKIGLKDAESLDAAMRNSDYLDKVAGKDAELYKIETKKVMAAERFNTAIEKVSVAFKSSLLPILEAIIPIVDHMAWAINLVAASIKTVGGVLSTGINLFSLGSISSKRKSENQASPAEVASGTVMSAALIFAIGKIGKSKFADKIGEKVGKVRGKFDQLSGALGSESNPMYVKVVGGTLGGGGGASDVASTILDNAGGAAATGTATAGASRFSKVKDFLSRGAGKVKSIASGGLSKAQDLFSRGAGRLKGFSAGAPEKIGKALNSLKNIKPSSIAKIGGVMAVAGAAFDYAQRKKEGQSTKQAATASVGGALGGIAGGAVSGAAMGAFLGPIGAAIGGLIGGTAGYLATTKIIDSHFDKNKSSSFTAQPFMYAGMNGMSGGGGISTSLNKPKATGTPVETSMVDMTPTTFKTMSSGISGINPNYGTTSMARESVMVNTLSKSVEATALMKSVKEKNIEKEKAHKEMMEQQLKILESIREKINQPAVAFFTDEGRRQVINQSRVRNSH